MSIENRINESGTLLPYIKAKIVNPITNEPVGVNEKGIINIVSGIRHCRASRGTR